MHPKRILFSFKYGFEGLNSALKTEPNLKLQVLIGLVGIFCATFFHINQIEWLICIIVWSLDFSLELTNTAIEDIVDSFTSDIHPAAKRAKDVAAAAVIVAFLAEAAVGLIIFLPYFINLFLNH